MFSASCSFAYRHFFFSVFWSFLFLVGCTGRHAEIAIDPGLDVVLEETPYYPQREYECGPAALAMLLGGSKVDVRPQDLVPQTYLPGRQGSLQLELAAAARRHGRISYVLDPRLSAVTDEIQAGRPVLVLQNIGLSFHPVYHYAVVIGARFPDRLVLHSAGERAMEMGMDRFLKTWERAGSWAMVALVPGRLPVNPDRERYLNAVAAFESSGHVLPAAEAYRTAISAWPEDQTALFGMATNAFSRGNYPDAEYYYLQLLRLHPDHIAALNNLAEVFVRQGLYEEALVTINRAAGVPGLADSPFRQAVQETAEAIKRVLRQGESGAKE